MNRLIALISFLACAVPMPAIAREPRHTAGCTTDGLVHVETGAEVKRHLARTVKLKEPGARLRGASRLRLPCGFHVEPSLFSLILTNGTEHRAYAEDNTLGFAPAFGFRQQRSVDQTLSSQKIPAAEVQQDGCMASLHQAGLDGVCASFGSPTLFFAIAKAADGGQRLVQFRSSSGTSERFTLAEIGDRVVGLSFIQPPDAGGGTVTVLTADGGNVYRFYIDSLVA